MLSQLLCTVPRACGMLANTHRTILKKKLKNVKKKWNCSLFSHCSQANCAGGCAVAAVNWSSSSTLFCLWIIHYNCSQMHEGETRRMALALVCLKKWSIRSFLNEVLACVRMPCGRLFSGKLLVLSIPELNVLSKRDCLFVYCYKGRKMRTSTTSTWI